MRFGFPMSQTGLIDLIAICRTGASGAFRKPQQRRQLPKKMHRVITELDGITAQRRSCQPVRLIMPFGGRHFDLHSFGFYALLSIMKPANSAEAF